MRLFIAIPFNSDHFYTFQKRLMAIPDLIGTFPHETHLTLKFIGDSTTEACRDIKRILSKVTFETFSVQLSDIGFFPNRSDPKIIWQGIKESPKLYALQKKIDSSIPAKKDAMNFHPHLTLMRIKGRWKGKADIISGIPIEKPSLRIDRCILYKSTLTPKGPVYEELLVI